ncbi:FAD-dependent oxidoreductase [Horticoccus luteus]|uniref:Tryptophan 2-monooxygenase n=1 Tax=Horticoccus luteus TaxID=2862869 RepID=A0A8F9TY24_9BACT|nr:NAD(P)/FAD-dependent oxidoreductase [Horticoccus luteus]QYM80106.1 FAD-dependent oxidoreductase [Horticoccus luteus]
MKDCDVIVIGAGVAGLAAAGGIARDGWHVRVIEARDRVGGRVWTIRPRGWCEPVELGAAFVHGGNAALWAAMRRAKMATRRTPGKHWLGNVDGIEATNDLSRRIVGVTQRIDAQRMRGWSFARFLKTVAGDVSADDRMLTESFVEGFEAASLDEMSAASLAGESPDDAEQFIVPGGYDGLVQQLAEEAVGAGAEFELKEEVTDVRWRKGDVAVRLRGGDMRRARAVVVTLPIGVWHQGSVTFAPRLRAKERAAARIGNGQVVRLTLRLDVGRWRALRARGRAPAGRLGFGFIHSRIAGVPVWWSMTKTPVLTGWAGGPAASVLRGATDGEVRQRAEQSLATLLGVPVTALRGAVRGIKLHRWDRDPWSGGAYSFVRAGGEGAARALRAVVQETMFFAGEATAEGEEVGTVHGALGSGVRAAEEVRNVFMVNARGRRGR